MTTYEKATPLLQQGQEIYGFDDDASLVLGKVVGVSDQGFDILWADLHYEIGYNFEDVTIIRDFVVERGHMKFFELYEAGRRSALTTVTH